MKKFFLAGLLMAASHAHAQLWSGILSPVGSGTCTTLAPSATAPECAIDWSQTGVVIPSPGWTQLGATITATGSDQTSAIQAALNGCGGAGHTSSTTGQYVLLAAGTFTINSSVTVPSYCELRGAGANLTILSGHGSTQAPVILGATSTSPPGGSPLTGSTSITAGATAGSTSITLASVSGVSTGTYLIISEVNNSGWVTANGYEGGSQNCGFCDGGWTTDGSKVRGQIVEVTGVAGSVVSITPGLYTAYTNSQFAVPFAATAKYAGVRQLQVFENNTGYNNGFFLGRCAYCWIEGSEVNYTDGNMMEVEWGYRDQIQSNYFSNAYQHGAGVDSDVFIDYKTSASQIVNNIVERGHNAMMLNWGAAGNVMAYNYSEGGYDAGGTNWTYDGILMHGAHPQFNLLEGNVSVKYNPDNIWGSSSHNTNFRNWFYGTTTVCNPLATTRVTVTCTSPANSFQVAYAEGINNISTYDNFVGDVTGSATQQALLAYGSGTMTNIPIATWPANNPIAFDFDTENFGFGYDAHADDGTTPTDSQNPYKTALLYKTYTFSNTTTNCIVGGTSSTCSASLPASFFLSAKPSWWGTIPYPSIGPDVTGGTGPGGHTSLTASNAAQNCYLNTMGGSNGGAGSPKTFNAVSCFGALSASTTWYVNHTGGTRFSTNVPTGLCDGTSAAAPVGTTPNQHCAWNDIRSLWTDGSYASSITGQFPAWGWVGTGGDTYLIDCSGGTKCRVGQNGPNSGDWYGLAGDPYDAGAPTPFPGTPTAHTKILGINYASCSAHSSKAVVQGGFGVSFFINLIGANYTDVQCLRVEQHDNCTHGTTGDPSACSTNFPLSDYISNGFVIKNNTTNLLLQDIEVDGMATTGIIGAPGDGVTLNRVVLTGNSSSGFNMDDGSGTTGQGNFTATGLVIYGNGCKTQWPYTGTVTMPWGVVNGMADCTSQSSYGGYGDGLGTTTVASAAPWHLNFTKSIFAYNTQDGQDLLHATGMGNSVITTLSLGYGNMGQQFKIGATNVTFQNNQINGNCFAMNQTSPAPPGMLPGYNTNPGFASDLCRAGGSTVAITVSDAGPAKIQDNTMIAANIIGYEIVPPLSPLTCTAACQLLYQGNLFVGYASSIGDPPGNGQNTNVIFLDSGVPGSIFANTGSAYSFNATSGSKSSCPNNTPGITETNAFCSTPQLNDISFHQTEFGNTQPSSSTSNVLGKGVTISGITTDYNGVTRPSPPAAGAFEFLSGGTVATPTDSPGAGTYSSAQSVILSTITGGATICYTTNGATPTATTAGTCDGAPTQTYTGAISVSTTTTIKAIGTLTGNANSSVLTSTYTISIPTVATPTDSPGAGTYSSTQSVTLSTSTGAATICFTTDGSTPTAPTPGTCSGGTTQTYTGAISVSVTTTIHALGTKSGFTNSGVLSSTYTISIPVVATPTALPIAGTYPTTQSVALSTITAGATICYTVDGSTPAAATAGTCSHGTTYSTAISVSVTTTIKALGTKSGSTNSSVLTAPYSIVPFTSPTIIKSITFPPCPGCIIHE